MRYLTSDFGVDCDSATHAIFRIVAGAIMATFGVGLPIIFNRLLKRNRHRLYDPSFFASFSFLYAGLSVERGQQGYDVTFTMPRKAIIVLIGNVLKDSVLQQLASALVMLLALITLLVLQPYSQPMWNVLESLSVSAILITILATLAYVRAQTNVTICAGYSDRTIPPGADEDCGTSRNFLAKMDIGATVLLIVVNLGVLALFAFIFIRMQRVQAIRLRVQRAGSAAAALAGAGAAPPGALARLFARCKRSPPVRRGSDAPPPRPLAPDEVTDQVLLILEGTVRPPQRPAGASRCCCRRGGAASEGTAAAIQGDKGPGQGQVQGQAVSTPTPTPARKRGCWSRLATRIVVGVEIPLHLACERAEELTALLQKGLLDADLPPRLDDDDRRDDEFSGGHDAAAFASAGKAGTASASAAAAGLAVKNAMAQAGGGGSGANAAARAGTLRFAASSASMVRPSVAQRGGNGTAARRGGSQGKGKPGSNNAKQQPSLFTVAAARRRNLGAYNTGDDGSTTVTGTGNDADAASSASSGAGQQSRGQRSAGFAGASLEAEAAARARLALMAVTAFKKSTSLAASAGSGSASAAGAAGGSAALTVTSALAASGSAAAGASSKRGLLARKLMMAAAAEAARTQPSLSSSSTSTSTSAAVPALPGAPADLTGDAGAGTPGSSSGPAPETASNRTA